MKNKKGFISMSLVYSFLVLFLFLITAILTCYMQKNTYMDAINKKISSDLDSVKVNYTTLFNTILNDNLTVKFDNVTYTDGLYYVEDENKVKLYFFRGNVQNNYVVYGKEIKGSSVNPICWKIVRTNADDSIKLAYYGNYIGSSCVKSSSLTSVYNSITDISGNDDINANYYTGGLYVSTHPKLASCVVNHGDVTANSTIKKSVENWFIYNTNLMYKISGTSTTTDASKASALVASNYFCNDTATSSTALSNYLCSEAGKLYLSTASGGTSSALTSLKNNVGLLTWQEVKYAGENLNGNHFLNYGFNYWTMTGNGSGNAWMVNGSGIMSASSVTTSLSYIPVINIVNTSSITNGNGLSTNPYIIDVEDD